MACFRSQGSGHRTALFARELAVLLSIQLDLECIAEFSPFWTNVAQVA